MATTQHSCVAQNSCHGHITLGSTAQGGARLKGARIEAEQKKMPTAVQSEVGRGRSASLSEDDLDIDTDGHVFWDGMEQ